MNDTSNKKSVYERIILNNEQLNFLNKVYRDNLYIKLMSSIHLDLLTNTLSSGTYHQSPVVRRALTYICENYVSFTKRYE